SADTRHQPAPTHVTSQRRHTSPFSADAHHPPAPLYINSLRPSPTARMLKIPFDGYFTECAV
ncbi:MAG: hypothetical protein LBJ01_11560, partial [Tannerella sp.]|nr:hypothetical protein [Tannerella sp.]